MGFKFIPEELKAYDNWVCRKSKIPYQPDGKFAKSNDKSTWSSYQDCMNAASSGDFDGIGFQFGNSPYVGIDIDHCIDPMTGQISDAAAYIVKAIDSYTEYSPSGTGIHIICKGVINGKGNKNSALGIEMYNKNRYFTMTGNTYHSTPRPVRESHELDSIHNRFIAKPVDRPVRMQIQVDISETDLIEKIRSNKKQGSKFHQFFDLGDTGEDPSGADLALCNMLAFWTNCNQEMMDSIFRRSRLMRDKWDRTTGNTTYGELTINKAINDCTRVYNHEQSEISSEGISNIVCKKSSEGKKKVLEPLRVYSAEELDSMELDMPEFIVNGFLPHGVAILASPPKFGKSWMCFDLAYSVSKGIQFLGFSTNKSNVLYFALEDGLSRLKYRMSKLRGDEKAPQGLDFVINSNRMDKGLIEFLEERFLEDPLLKLVIIDTFQKIKPPCQSRKPDYEMDYQHLGMLHDLSIKYNVSIMIVHHTRKSKGYPEDPFECILGSTALQGATDFMAVIKKKRVDDNFATLSYKGRDVPEGELRIQFSENNCRWANKGDSNTIESMRREREYKENPIVRTIIAKFEELNNDITKPKLEYLVRPKDLMKAVLDYTGQSPGTNEKAFMNEMKKYLGELEQKDGIRCILPEKQTTHNNIRGTFYKFIKT